MDRRESKHKGVSLVETLYAMLDTFTTQFGSESTYLLSLIIIIPPQINHPQMDVAPWCHKWVDWILSLDIIQVV